MSGKGRDVERVYIQTKMKGKEAENPSNSPLGGDTLVTKNENLHLKALLL